MTTHHTCQASLDEGTLCGKAAVITKPVALCYEHEIEVGLVIVPSLLKMLLHEARTASAGRTRVLTEAEANLVDSAQTAQWPEGERHSPLVYFLANGGRVKIGQTNGIRARVRALSLREDAVLLLLHGGLSLERALHAKFDTYRIDDSEWFELSPELVRFVGDKSHGQLFVQPAQHLAPARASAGTRVPRQVREAQRAQAEQEIADIVRAGGMPDVGQLSRKFNKRETWVGDRIRSVRRRLEEAGPTDPPQAPTSAPHAT
ncbi:GIY-YIG nuclease family protein [Kitasatospora sp. NPDC004669]|uniref:GIY-YIG nuclease family protein n=1 Tax=Kitasatospora sp. NPDC004669 TaxID=3154555 RepID=UPI0033BE1899